MPVALVTGPRGFLGRAVVAELLRRGWEIVGVGRGRTSPWSGVRWLTADLVLGVPDVDVDAVIHLACPPRERWAEDERAADVLAAIDAHVLRAARRAHRAVLVSSAAVYGDRLPVGSRANEALPLAPTTRYGLAKMDQETRWRTALAQDGLLVVRPFNATGPGEPPSLVCRAAADRLRAAAPGDAFPVRSSESARDFLDVRDIAEALCGLFDAHAHGVVNVCSGGATLVRALVERLVAISGRQVVIDPDGRGADSQSVGDPSELHRRVGWRPRRDLEASLNAVWSEACGAVGERV